MLVKIRSDVINNYMNKTENNKIVHLYAKSLLRENQEVNTNFERFVKLYLKAFMDQDEEDHVWEMVSRELVESGEVKEEQLEQIYKFIRSYAYPDDQLT